MKKALKNKKQQGFTLIEILIALAVLIITAAGGAVVWQKEVTPTPTLPIFPTLTSQVSPIPTLPVEQTNRSQQLQEELRNIPSKDLYYYYQEHNQEQNPQQKIFLRRDMDEKGVYFIWEKDPSNTKMRITQEFIVKFQSHVSTDQIQRLIREEGFITERYMENSNVYILSTTEQSKFIDGLRTANYLHENYSTLIDYASPNLLREINPEPVRPN